MLGKGVVMSLSNYWLKKEVCLVVVGRLKGKGSSESGRLMSS